MISLPYLFPRGYQSTPLVKLDISSFRVGAPFHYRQSLDFLIPSPIGYRQCIKREMTFPGPYAASLNGAYDRQSQVFGYSVPNKYIRPENIQYPHMAHMAYSAVDSKSKYYRTFSCVTAQIVG